MGRWAERNARKTIKEEMYQKLSKMFRAGKGRSRHEDKKTGLDRKFIYSESTYKTYTASCKDFRRWINENHPECKHLKDCRKYVNEYLQSLISAEKSAYTISTRKAALVKLFEVDFSEFMETPGRYRKNITKSRYAVKYDAHVSKATEERWAKITSATGLRLSELTRIRGTDLRYLDGKYMLYVHKGTKGGKDRYCWVLDEDVAKLIELAGDRPAFPNVPKAYDNHHYRAIYAQKLYALHARPVDTIPKEDRYVMRGDMKGVVLDKAAMRLVSSNLGHNRISVIAQSYLY